MTRPVLKPAGGGSGGGGHPGWVLGALIGAENTFDMIRVYAQQNSGFKNMGQRTGIDLHEKARMRPKKVTETCMRRSPNFFFGLPFPPAFFGTGGGAAAASVSSVAATGERSRCNSANPCAILHPNSAKCGSGKGNFSSMCFTVALASHGRSTCSSSLSRCTELSRVHALCCPRSIIASPGSDGGF